MKDKSFDMYIVQGSDLPSGNGRVLPLVAKPLDAHDSHPASGGGSHSYVGLDKAMVVACCFQLGEMFLTRHVYPPRKVGVSILITLVKNMSVVSLANCNKSTSR